MAFGKGKSSSHGTDNPWLSKLLLVPVLLVLLILLLPALHKHLKSK